MTGPAHDDERRFWRAVWLVTAVTLLGLLALETTAIDMALARLAWDPARHVFPLREHFFTTRVSHDGVKFASTLVFVWILVAVWKPVGLLSRLDRPRRVYLFAAVALCLLVVASLKRGSALHCPWGLVEFGGSHAYLRLFDAVPEGWQHGACFPAGHALSAFAYIGGYFAWREVDRRIARGWLIAVLVVGAWLTWTLSAGLAWLARPRLRPVNRTGSPAG